MERNASGAVESALTEVEAVEGVDFRNARTALLLGSVPVLLVEGRPEVADPVCGQPLGLPPVMVPDALIVNLTPELPRPSCWGLNE